MARAQEAARMAKKSKKKSSARVPVSVLVYTPQSGEPELQTIDGSIESLHAIVEGDVEVRPLSLFVTADVAPELMVVMNEDGLVQKLPHNRLGLVGRFAVARVQNRKLAALTADHVSTIKAAINASPDPVRTLEPKTIDQILQEWPLVAPSLESQWLSSSLDQVTKVDGSCAGGGFVVTTCDWRNLEPGLRREVKAAINDQCRPMLIVGSDGKRVIKGAPIG